MVEIKLIILAKKWNKKKRPTTNIKNFPNEFILIKNATSFLTEDASVPQRLWHILNNTTKIPKCNHCNSFVKWHPSKKGYVEYCSRACINKSEKIKNKIKTTCIKKYGVDNPLKSSLIQEKRKQTCIKKYGVDNPTKNKNIVKKVKKSLFDTFKKNRNIIVSKRKQTCIKKYGVDNPLKSSLIQEKRKQTCIKKYGVEYHTQLHYSKKTLSKLNYEWLKTEYSNKKRSTYDIAFELNIERTTVCDYLHKFGITIENIHGYSKMAINWLTQMAKEQNIHIQHAENEGEYHIPGTRYRADGYCKETNTIYEFYGDIFHGNLNLFEENEICHPYTNDCAGILYMKTIKREQEIINLGYKVINIWESDYKKSINKKIRKK